MSPVTWLTIFRSFPSSSATSPPPAISVMYAVCKSMALSPLRTSCAICLTNVTSRGKGTPAPFSRLNVGSLIHRYRKLNVSWLGEAASERTSPGVFATM